MVRDKNPTLTKTCIICRQKIIHQLKVCSDGKRDSEKTGQLSVHWKTMCAESFCMLFGLPENHPFVSIFVNNDGRCHSQFCPRCYEDVTNVHFIFWQLQNLEQKCSQIQTLIMGRLRCNYDSIPVATVFSSISERDVASRVGSLRYDEIVKVLFERIKERKDNWPKPMYAERWKLACNNAARLSTGVSSQTQQSKVEVILPDLKMEEESTNHELVGSDGDGDYCSEFIIDGTASEVSVTRSKRKSVKNYDEDYVWPTQKGEGVDAEGMGMESHEEMSYPEEDKEKSKRETVGKKLKKKRKPKPKDPSHITRYLCVEEPDVCSRTYSCRKHLKTHVRTFHQARKFSCDFEGCESRFMTEEKMQSHKDRVHDKVKKKGKEVCEACGVEVTKGDMKKHFYLKHLGKGQFCCERCSMDFNDSEALQQHQALHETAEYPFLCVVCQKLFTNSLDLKAHVASNHLSSGLKCDICGIMKPNDFLLQRHMKVHEVKPLFVCECGKSFRSKAHFNYHKEHFHLNTDKQYPCSVCGKTFRHMKNVVRHMITHSEDKPFKCNICSKTFNYSHLLKKHEEIHSGTKNYGCEICGKRFRQEQNLKQHMRSHRPKAEKDATKKQIRKPKIITTSSSQDSTPIILEVKGEAEAKKIETIVEKVDSKSKNEPVRVTQNDPVASIVEVSEERQPNTNFETVQEIHLIEQLPPHTATTVVFVSTDQNLQWLQ